MENTHTSSVQNCIKDVHNDLKHGECIRLKEWVLTGKSPIYFIKRAVSYPYYVRHMMIHSICPTLAPQIKVKHPGFQGYGYKTIYDWIYLELVERCKYPLHIESDEDEIWAFQTISIPNTTEMDPISMWQTILHVFDGSERWVRLLAAFLCSRGSTYLPGVITCFDRYHMVLGWNNWMNYSRIFDLMRITNEQFYTTSVNTIIIEEGGEYLYLGLIQACLKDDPLFHTQHEFNVHIKQAIKNIFHSPSLDSDTESVVSV